MSGRAILRRGLRRIPPQAESSPQPCLCRCRSHGPRGPPARPPSPAPQPPALRPASPVTLTAPQSPAEGEGEGCTVQEKSPIHFPFRQQGKEEKNKNALHAQLFLKFSSRNEEQKAGSAGAVSGAEGGWLLSVPQAARILSFSSGSLSLSPHLFLLRAPLPLPFPARLESQMKTRGKNNKKQNPTNTQTRQTKNTGDCWHFGSALPGEGALRRGDKERKAAVSGDQPGAGVWQTASPLPAPLSPAGPGPRGCGRRCPHSPAPAGGEGRARCRRGDSRPAGGVGSARAAPARSLRKRSATQRQ